MSNVVDFPAKKTPHVEGEALCLACKHAWVAVAPCPAPPWLECPECGTVRGLYKYHFEKPNTMHWRCRCENELMFVTPDGIYCPNCGVWQNPYAQ